MGIRCGRTRSVRSFFAPTAMLVFGALAGFTLNAKADISDPVFIVQADNDSGNGSYSAAFDEGQWDPSSQTFLWDLAEPVDLYDDTRSEWVATVLNAELCICATPPFEVELSVGVIAGDSLTTFAIASPLLAFQVIPASYAQGRATASVTVTHLAGDYALLTGLGTPGTGAFRSYYNGYLSEGTRFTHLVGLVYVDNGGTANASQSDPSSGYRAIGEDVWDLSTEIAFTLTPGDLAFATTTSGMPEPCLGDLDGDGMIDQSDLAQFLIAYGTSVGDPNYDPAADFYADGTVDLGDLAQLLAVYGESCM